MHTGWGEVKNDVMVEVMVRLVVRDGQQHDGQPRASFLRRTTLAIFM